MKLKTLEGLDDETELEDFFKDLSTVKDVNGNQVFPLVIKLGTALLTDHNSSSSAERDCSLMVSTDLLMTLFFLYNFIFRMHSRLTPEITRPVS